MKLAPYNVIPKSTKIVKVIIDVKYRGKRLNTWAYGIKTQFINYPKDAWNDYAKGHVYNWECLDQAEHPNHNPAGYLEFCQYLTKKLKKAAVGVCGDYPFKEKKVPKLGDVVYDVKKKRWYLVDVG